MDVERIDLDEWERVLPDAGFEVFHVPEALEVIDRHTSGELRLFAGYKGDRPVGLFPLVVEDRSVGKTVFSPPPALGIPRLGPILMPASPKRRKQERVNRTFTTEVLQTVPTTAIASLVRVIASPEYPDPRPFAWEGYDVSPTFTYSIPVESRSADSIFDSFSRSLRREIRDAQDEAIKVAIEGSDVAGTVHDRTRSRYEEQGKRYPLDRSYVTDLTSTLADTDRCRIFTARSPDGELLGGITVLYSNDAAYFWQGGVREIHEGVTVNSLLHWSIIENLIDDPPIDSVSRYDLMGANTARLCRYKSKFGGDLTPYYRVESQGIWMDLAKWGYRMVDGLR